MVQELSKIALALREMVRAFGVMGSWRVAMVFSGEDGEPCPPRRRPPLVGNLSGAASPGHYTCR